MAVCFLSWVWNDPRNELVSDGTIPEKPGDLHKLVRNVATGESTTNKRNAVWAGRVAQAGFAGGHAIVRHQSHRPWRVVRTGGADGGAGHIFISVQRPTKNPYLFGSNQIHVHKDCKRLK
jgi:hypothetical protein